MTISKAHFIVSLRRRGPMLAAVLQGPIAVASSIAIASPSCRTTHQAICSLTSAPASSHLYRTPRPLDLDRLRPLFGHSTANSRSRALLASVTSSLLAQNEIDHLTASDMLPRLPTVG